MFRRLPILLIVLMAASGARAQQGFFDQFFGSLKNGSAASEPVGEATGSVPGDSEPLALQPTTVSRPHYKKRTHATYRHHQASPEHHTQPRSEPQRAERERPTKKTPSPSPSVSREVTARPAATRDVTPEDDASPNVAPAEDSVAPTNDNVAAPAAWPDPAPPAVAPWPAERTPVDAVQTARPDDVQQEAPPQTLERREEAAQPAQDIEPKDTRETQSFLDRERYVLAGFSAAWLLLGIVMFMLRRPIAQVIDARRRPILRAEIPRIPSRLPAAPQLTLILANAERDDPAADNNETELRDERRVVSIG